MRRGHSVSAHIKNRFLTVAYWAWNHTLLELWLIALRIRVLFARATRRAVILDGDYYRNAVDDFHENLRSNPKIRSRALIAQVPLHLIIGSVYGYRARQALKPLGLQELRELQWDGIWLYHAYLTRICGDAGRLHPAHSPVIDRDYLYHHFMTGIAVYELHKRLVRTLRPNALIVYQGAYGMSRLLHELRRRYNVRTVAIESSFLGDRVYFDSSAGMILNRFSLAKHGREYRAMRPEAPDAGEKAWKMWRESLAHKIADHRTLGTDTAKEFRARFGFDLGQPYALLLGQVQVDASVMLDSPMYPNSVDYVMHAIHVCRRQGIPLVVRFHPREARIPPGADISEDSSYQQVLARLGGQTPPGVILVPGNDVDTFLLVRHARIGMTLNSQSGLEMALHGKPVVTAAECLYARKGFTWDVAHPAGLESIIADAWRHAESIPIDLAIRQGAGQFMLDMTQSCMPLRQIEGSEKIILRQFGLIEAIEEAGSIADETPVNGLSSAAAFSDLARDLHQADVEDVRVQLHRAHGLR